MSPDPSGSARPKARYGAVAYGGWSHGHNIHLFPDPDRDGGESGGTGNILGSTTVEGTATNTAQVNRQEGSLEPLATVIDDTIGNERGAGALFLGVAKTFNYSKDSSESKTAPAAKAIRAALVAGSDYMDCLFVQQGRCLDEYAARDTARRRSTQEILNLD